MGHNLLRGKNSYDDQILSYVAFLECDECLWRFNIPITRLDDVSHIRRFQIESGMEVEPSFSCKRHE